MPIQRVFLGWDGPMLPRAAAWLREHLSSGAGCDLGGVLVVVPGGRAGRRLLEVLVTASGGGLTPPTIVTAGALPEQLYRSEAPVADDLRCLLARIKSLRAAKPEVLGVITTHRPADNDLAGWVALALQLAGIQQDLAAGNLAVRDVPEKLASMPDFHDETRWAALAELEEAYERELRAAGWIDVHAARAAAIRDRRCTTDKHVVLLATIDLPAVTGAMLAQLTGAVTALIHAPASEADNYDEQGCPIVERWMDRPLDLKAEQVRVVDRPADEVAAVLRAIGSADDPSSLGGRYAASEVTIGLGDEALGPALRRALEWSDVPARLAVGRVVGQTTPATLLETLSRFRASHRFDDLAALVRHPDFETHVLDLDPRLRQALGQWQTLLDRYASEHLHEQFTGQWLGQAQTRRRLKAVHDAALALTPAHERKQPLGRWTAPLLAVLRTIYGRRPLRRYDERDHDLLRSLQAIGETLAEQADLKDDESLTPTVSFSDAARLALLRVREQRLPTADAPSHRRAAVELLGWLELQLDDAPAVIVTGFNEGLIPSHASHDAFLPDHVRRVLGLTDNRRRYVRDLTLLTAMTHAHEKLVLIASRHDEEGNPRSPSRLMLARQETKLPAVVQAFYSGSDAEAPATPLLPAGGVSRFVVPPPQPPAEPITRLSVTAFADYLACPYRFYLKHVRKLEALDDRAVELDALRFGSLAHEVLQAFGHSGLRDSDDAHAIAAELSRLLDERVRELFGPHPRPAVALQREQLRHRLDAFARWQAQQTAQDWRIIHVEDGQAQEATVEVDGQPFVIVGRIDRIDRHPTLGHRVLDYKTGDKPQKPQNVHRRGDEWINLQLPLYELLARRLNITGAVALGFLALSKQTERDPLLLAPWSSEEIAQAQAVASEVIRGIRAGRFWPPTFPYPYEDELTGICMDKCVERRLVWP